MSHGGDDSPYLVFGDFALFFLQHLQDRGMSKENEANWLPASLQVIDQMLTSGDAELENLIQVGVLEVLDGNPDALKLVKSHLSAQGQEKFEEWIRISH